LGKADIIIEKYLSNEYIKNNKLKIKYLVESCDIIYEKMRSSHVIKSIINKYKKIKWIPKEDKKWLLRYNK